MHRAVPWTYLTLLVLSSLFLPGTAQASEWHSRAWTVMTTRAFLEFRADSDPETINAIFASVADEFTRIELTFSPWVASSELSRINRDAYQAGIEASGEMFAMFQTAGEFAALTDGAFDASFSGSGQLYDFRTGIAPGRTALSIAQRSVGWRHVRLDEHGRRIRYLQPGTRVDFGGIAKGYAIDRAVDILRAYGIRDAYVALGGDGYALGERDGRPWQIGIRHPRGEAISPVMIPASDLAISTSGDYERFFERDGERIHHILSPQTGQPAHGLVSVTVLAGDSTTADALATGIFVLGREAGLALVNRLGDVSAVLIDSDGQVHYSDDLAPLDSSEEPPAPSVGVEPEP